MRAQAKDRLRKQLDLELIAIALALRVAVLAAAGHRAAEIARQLDCTGKQVRDSISRIEHAHDEL